MLGMRWVDVTWRRNQRDAFSSIASGVRVLFSWERSWNMTQIQHPSDWSQTTSSELVRTIPFLGKTLP